MFRGPRIGAVGLFACASLCGCLGTASDRASLDEELARAMARTPSAGSPVEMPITAQVLGTRRLEVLLRPTPLRGAEGLACRAGRILVTERLADRISEVQADGSVSRLSTPPELIDPRDLVFDEAAGLFVASGEPGGLWHEQSGRWRRIGTDLSEATGVAMVGGRLYVAECARGGRLLELDPSSGTTRAVRAENLGCPGRIAIDASGAVIVPLQENGTVVRIDSTTGARTLLGEGIDLPSAVGQAPDGTWLVLESGSGRIRRLDGGATAVQLAPGVADLVTCGATLVVSVATTGALHAFKPWPQGGRVLVPGGLVTPGGIAFDGEDVLVADRVSIKRIRGQQASLVVMARAGGLPPPVGLAGGLPGLAWATSPEQGDLVQVDLGRGEVSRIATGLDWPTAVARTPTGDLVVAETGAGRVIEVGGGQTLGSGLLSPVAIALRGQTVLTVEPDGGRVLALHAGEAPGLVASGLSGPAGLASELRQPVYVAEERSGSILLHANDGSDRPIATGLALRTRADEHPLPVPIALAPDGSVVIASPEDGSVLRIVPD